VSCAKHVWKLVTIYHCQDKKRTCKFGVIVYIFHENWATWLWNYWRGWCKLIGNIWYGNWEKYPPRTSVILHFVCLFHPANTEFLWMNHWYIHSEQLRQEVLMMMNKHFCLGVCAILVWYVDTDIYGKPVYSFVRSLLPCTLTCSKSCKLHDLWPKKSTVK